MEHSSGKKSMVSKGWAYKAKWRNYLSVSHNLHSLIPSFVSPFPHNGKNTLRHNDTNK
jgi:hypothetical protein